MRGVLTDNRLKTVGRERCLRGAVRHGAIVLCAARCARVGGPGRSFVGTRISSGLLFFVLVRMVARTTRRVFLVESILVVARMTGGRMAAGRTGWREKTVDAVEPQILNSEYPTAAVWLRWGKAKRGIKSCRNGYAAADIGYTHDFITTDCLMVLGSGTRRKEARSWAKASLGHHCVLRRQSGRADGGCVSSPRAWRTHGQRLRGGPITLLARRGAARCVCVSCCVVCVGWWFW